MKVYILTKYEWIIDFYGNTHQCSSIISVHSGLPNNEYLKIACTVDWFGEEEFNWLISGSPVKGNNEVYYQLGSYDFV